METTYTYNVGQSVPLETELERAERAVNAASDDSRSALLVPRTEPAARI